MNASRDGYAAVYELAAETDGIALGNGGGVCSNGNGWEARGVTYGLRWSRESVRDGVKVR